MSKTIVWIIDDEPDLGEIFVDTFSSNNVLVLYFNSASAALLALKESSPNVFFIDYRMPEMDGDQLGSLLPANIPKFLVTGEINPKVKANFAKIINKPYNFLEIEELISINGNNN